MSKEMEMFVERKHLFAMKTDERITIEVPTVLVLTEGEIIVAHQKCKECRPKTTMLKQVGTQITLESGKTYQVKNNTMAKSSYLVIYPVINQSD